MTRKTVGVCLTTAVAVAVSLTAAALELPTLDETQRLRIANTVQAMEIAQLKAQAAQRDYDRAREQLRTLLQSLQRDGYVLDLQTLTYTAIEKDESDR